MTKHLEARLSARGLVLLRAVPLSRAGGSPAYRLDLADGARAKAREFATARQASAVWRRLRAAPPGVLPRPLLRCGRLLVIEFVEGVPLDRLLRGASTAQRERLVRAAGRLVGRLHGSPLRGRVSSPRDHHAFLLRIVRRLRRRGLIDADTAAGLSAIERPRPAPLVLTHGDVCPENLVLTAAGRLRLIDEERLALRPAGFELARAVARWRLTPELESVLVAAYRRAGGSAPAWRRDREFWLAVALAISAAYRLRRRLPGLGPVLQRLRTLGPLGKRYEAAPTRAAANSRKAR